MSRLDHHRNALRLQALRTTDQQATTTLTKVILTAALIIIIGALL